MRDDKEFNIKFVGLIEHYPCIYDNTREDYNFNYVLDQAWIDLSKDIGEGATVAKCKQRWRSLRSAYTNTLNKRGSAMKRQYYLEPYMRYINPYTKTRKAKGNSVLPFNEEKTDNGDVHESEETTVEYIKKEVCEDDSLSQHGENPCLDFNQDDAALQERNVTTLGDNTEGNTGEVKKEDGCCKSIAEDDADRHFLLSLLPDMKNMTDKQKRLFKISILNLAAELLDE